jgi:glycosyltransferase involved in cell wall biosynthesis
MKVKIYPLVDVFYYSYYIEGLIRLYGKGNIIFTREDFPNFPERNFAAIVENGGSKVKIVIDAFDTPRINSFLLDWCDIYAKLNFNTNYIPLRKKRKIIPIGPSFGIKIWNLPETIWFGLCNYIKSRDVIYFKRNFFANYWRQYKRIPLNKYQKKLKVEDNYIFFISSLWEKEQKVNLNRKTFISLCKDIKGLDFEGGFAPRSDGNDLGYSTYMARRITLKKYLKKIKRSCLVFNTPAVEDCFGWKLGEFLALGKAIISIPNNNTLNEPLVHGKHIHFVSANENDISDGIEKIREDSKYRKYLENNSKKYFQENLLPEIVLTKIINHAY